MKISLDARTQARRGRGNRIKPSFQRVQRSLNHCDSKDGESLGNVLVKHISKLEKEKLEAVQEATARVQKKQHECDGKNEDSLDSMIVIVLKHNHKQ